MSAHATSAAHDEVVMLLWVAWMIITPAGPLIGWLSYRRFPSLSKRAKLQVITISASLLIGTALFLASRLSLRSFLAQSALVAVAYISFCEVTWLVARAKPRWLTIVGPVFSIALALIVAVVVYTGLGFLFAVGGMVPTRNLQLGHNLVLHVTEDGGAPASHNSATLNIAKQPRWAPGLEYLVYRRFVQDDECEADLLKVEISNDATQGQIFCGSDSIDQFHISF